MKNILILAMCVLGMMTSCVKEPKMSQWKVTVTSTENVNHVSIQSSDYSFNEDLMTTTQITKEFLSPKIGSVGVKAWGSGELSVKIWKDGVLKEKSGVSGGSGLILNY